MNVRGCFAGCVRVFFASASVGVSLDWMKLYPFGFCIWECCCFDVGFWSTALYDMHGVKIQTLVLIVQTLLACFVKNFQVRCLHP